MKTIDQSHEVGALERLLAPLSESLTPAMARRLVQFRADASTQARIDELATKCTEGELTRAERREYEGYVDAIHFISVLQAKARIALSRRRKGR